jgi:predicted transposase YdaD
VRRCKTLVQYGAFVDKVRSFLEELGDREKAMRVAIKYCQEHEILKEFLGEHATEVMSMLLEEYTVEDALALARKESLEEGREEGRGEGREEAVNNLLVYGMTPEQISQALKLPLETVIQYQAGK